MIAIGLGCRRDVETAAVLCAVEAAMALLEGVEMPPPFPFGIGGTELLPRRGRGTAGVAGGGGGLPRTIAAPGPPPLRQPAAGPPPPPGEEFDDTCLASAWFKHDEPALADAARQLGLPLRLIDADSLAAQDGAGHSETAQRLVGLGSVAEAAALAAAGSGARLIVSRITVGGVTCAIALGE